MNLIKRIKQIFCRQHDKADSWMYAFEHSGKCWRRCVYCGREEKLPPGPLTKEAIDETGE